MVGIIGYKLKRVSDLPKVFLGLDFADIYVSRAPKFRVVCPIRFQ